tara:strand:- start:712 stop:927 length:216 start_codon:yes stop_codon:yes gene_type:complete
MQEKIYKFGDVSSTPHEIIEEIESRGYKKAVKTFQNKYPKIKLVAVEWVKNGIELTKLQKLPLGRKKKLNG